MVRGRVISFVLMLLVWSVQCNVHPTQFDYIGGKYDFHKLPDQNTSGPFLVQVRNTYICQTNVFYFRIGDDGDLVMQRVLILLL